MAPDDPLEPEVEDGEPLLAVLLLEPPDLVLDDGDEPLAEEEEPEEAEEEPPAPAARQLSEPGLTVTWDE